MTPISDKYVVLKISDWLDNRQILNAAADDPHHPDPSGAVNKVIKDLDAARLDDAVVIRQQDIFAAGVLFTYAGAVQTAIEVLGQQNIPVPDELQDLRDRFFEFASAAEASPIKKFPDA